MKITLDEDVIAEAITDYLDAKGFDAKNVELKSTGSYSAVIAEIDLWTDEEREEQRKTKAAEEGNDE